MTEKTRMGDSESRRQFGDCRGPALLLRGLGKKNSTGRGGGNRNILNFWLAVISEASMYLEVCLVTVILHKVVGSSFPTTSTVRHDGLFARSSFPF